MNRSTYIAAALASLSYFLPLQAEAARCSSGAIYYRSAGVCISKASAIRAGVYRPRHAKASVKHRVKKRPPVERAKAQPPIVAASFPPPSPPWKQRTPMIDGGIDAGLNAPAPTVFVHPRFGGLIPMPESPAAWAARNASTFGEN
ncbi:MAG: hypothetical protein ACK4MV_16245 [Beijerinckiaceae bacterium]